MNDKSRRTLALLCALAACAGVSACGSSSKSPSKTTPTTTTTAAAGSPERAQAKAALVPWTKADVKLNKAIIRWNANEPRDGRAHDVLAVRRDAYDYRNGIYNFDIAIRKINFPTSVEPDVNTLLDTNRKKIAALDGMSQSSGTSVIQRYFLKAKAADVTGAANRVYHDLLGLAGAATPAPSSGASSETDKLANALLKAKQQTGAKGPKDAKCAAKLLMKTLTAGQRQQIEAGVIPQQGRVSNAIGAALLTCQLTG
jgi:hypothetical protein